MPFLGQHAVVIGSSMAGMLAGRVLTDHFEHVTILERDILPDTPSPRKGLPQAHHLHILLMRGQLIFEHLFPGLVEEMVAAGIPRLDVGCDFRWLMPAGWGVPFHSGITILTGTRDLIDLLVRNRVRALPGLQLRDGVEGAGLLPTDDGHGVRGVLARSRREGGGEEELPADLVVEATGRGSHLKQWLAALGYPQPEETVLSAHLGYASRYYHPPADFAADWRGLMMQGDPPRMKRGGVLFPIEGKRWLVTLAGGGGDYPPTEEGPFMDFAKSLRSTLIFDSIQRAEPISPIVGYRGTENRARHYEHMRRWPHGLVALGDAAIAFNPVYGQGMTTAGLGVLALDRALRRGGDGLRRGLEHQFQKDLVRAAEPAWLLATGADARYPDLEGNPPELGSRMSHWYVDRVLELATQNRQVRYRLLEVLQLLRPPMSLLTPTIAGRVLWLAATRRHGQVGAPRVAGD
jgi:2-polyprenyl-6-methoxyphenol hydroxylase-like FAD-dependent oxidoreductase